MQSIKLIMMATIRDSGTTVPPISQEAADELYSAVSALGYDSTQLFFYPETGLSYARNARVYNYPPMAGYEDMSKVKDAELLDALLAVCKKVDGFHREPVITNIEIAGCNTTITFQEKGFYSIEP